MAMSKKHFDALARELKDHRPKLDDYEGRPKEYDAANKMHGDCCRAVAFVCQGENHRFDFDRFLEACDVYGSGAHA